MDKETEKIYLDYRNHLLESRRQSYDQFDKAIFLLSGGGLTVSLTILKDIIPLNSAQFKFLLATTWIFFMLSMIFTLVSFISSQYAIDKQIKLTDDYFLNDNESALSQQNIGLVTTKYLNYSSAASFILGVISLLLFVYLNI